jgi:hypothetical protein
MYPCPVSGLPWARLALFLLLTAALAGCGGRAGAEGGSESPEGEAQRLLVLRLAGEAAGLETAIREEGFFGWLLPRREDWRAEVVPGGGPASGEPDAEVVVSLLPAPEEVRARVAGSPADLSGRRVVFDGRRYDDPAVTLTLRLGERDDRWLVAGSDPEAVVEAVDRAMLGLLGARFSEELDGAAAAPDYRVRAGRWLERTGSLRRAGDRTVIDPAADRDGFAERDRWLAGLVAVDVGAVRLLAPAGREGELRPLARDLARAATEMAPRVPVEIDRPVVLAVEDDYPSMVRHTGRIGRAVPADPAWLTPAGSRAPDLHLVVHPDDRWAYRHALARHLLERAGLAGSRPPWIEAGAALWLSEEWFGRPAEAWLPLLAATEVLPEAGELLAAGVQGDSSEPLWTPAAAAVVAELPGTTLAEKLARPIAAADVAPRLAALARRTGEAPAPPTRQRPLPAGFLRGVSLAMRNTLDGGYQAPGVAARLDRLAGLGSDAVSLMPFAYQGDPRAPEMRFLNQGVTSETDVGVVHAARLARAGGFRLLWKPHVWVGHESWPGDVEMTSEADWRSWFRSYRRYVLHHAFLARAAVGGVDLFAVGVELERTVGREEEWRRLIEAVRRFDPGPLTYAANWGQGVHEVAFWDALDAVGVDAYWPLSEDLDADDAALARGAEEVAGRLAALAGRTRKPVILTEVGFPARRAAWLRPHEEGGELSAADQARAYRALLGALHGRPWLRGVFAWKVRSDNHPYRGEGPDFGFLDRPAEAVVAEFFRRVEERAGVGGAGPPEPATGSPARPEAER